MPLAPPSPAPSPTPAPAPAQGAAPPRRRGVWARAERVARRLVVIGNGMASYKLCERLVALGASSRWRVQVIGEEPQPAYDRVGLTRYFNRPDESSLLLASREWYAAHGLELATGDPAVAVDREARVVRTWAGRVIPYDTLVFATGSSAYRPEIEGATLPGVFVYRTLCDLAAIRAYARYSKRAAVLGGGLLGLEAAQALGAMGLETWVVERGVGLMARQLDPEGSRLLRSQVERLGLRVLTGMTTERIDPIGTDRLLQFACGQCLRVQLVIVAAGIVPRDTLAAACGLEIAPKGGIAVNDHLETSDPSVFALGECASHRGVIYGLAAPAYQMADALASTLAGSRKRFRGCDLSTRLKLPGLEVSTLGRYQEGETHLLNQGDGTYRRLVFDGNRLVGAVSLGEWPELPRVQELVERHGRVGRWRRERFAKTGRLWRRQAPCPVAQWPASAIVCICRSVRRGALSAAQEAGCGTVEQLAAATGASTVCGSCRPLLVSLVGGVGGPAALPGVCGLMIASLAALALALAVWVVPALPVSDSVEARVRLESLWYDSMAKQITGYGLAGAALLSLVLSARKRIRRFAAGTVGHWRVAHAALGVLTLVGLVSHTGFRLGENLNFVLMTNFLLLAALGGFAGLVNALEARLSGPAARRLRQAVTWGHVALTWPLPVLVVAHVLAAYLF